MQTASNKTAGHHQEGSVWYVDTQFIQKVQGVYPGSRLEHMGFGDFRLSTPDGNLEFSRSSHSFEGQSGRSHKVYDDTRGKVIEKAIKLMEQKGKSNKTASVKALRSKLIRKAYENPEMRSALAPQIRKLASKTMRVAGMNLPVHIALNIQEARIAAGPLSITKMPGFSGMQLRQEIERLGTIQRDIKLATAQLGQALKDLKGLEKDEKGGIAALKKSASEMREKGKMIAEAETAMLQFTTYLTEKRPGIEQMIADPDSKFGEKAGDFFGRVAAKLGKEVSDAVQVIYTETSEDLSHTTMAVRGIKIVQKTAGIDSAIVKKAGLSDMVIDVKEWLSGKANQFMGFAGDIARWVKGFTERTKIVKSHKDKMTKAINKAEAQMDKALKAYA